MSSSDLIRARSSRTSSAITWNFTRLVGPTLPLTDLASTSRTRRARMGRMGAGSLRRGRVRSEERRVGKECRARRATEHGKKNEAGEKHTISVATEGGKDRTESAN